MPSSLHTELARPQQFEEAAGLVDEAAVARNVLCGPDPEPVARAVLRFAAAGYRRVYLHQVGPDQAGFLDAWTRSVRPLLAGSLAAA